MNFVLINWVKDGLLSDELFRAVLFEIVGNYTQKHENIDTSTDS